MSAPASLWRPGVDAPLFPAELLGGPAGLDELAEAPREQLCAYLVAVVRARGPLHVNLAWNAVHYGWDLATGGYAETLLNLDSLPTIDARSLEATPAGVIAALPSATPVRVEVVHVEADDLICDSDGDISAARSGAPYDSDIRLRAVVDDTIFGPLGSEQRRVVDRFRRRGAVDRFGHVLSPTAPVDTELAEVTAGDPIQAYAGWLAADPDRLGGGPVPAALGIIEPEPTKRAIVASLHALLALAEADHRLVVIGEHLSLAESGPWLAEGDLEDIVRWVSLVRAGQQRYTSVGAALRHLGTDRPIQRVKYVAALVELTAALTSAAVAHGGTTEIRLRLDDAGRGGGIWRTIGAKYDPSDGYDPRTPLGLGYAASLNLPKRPGPPSTDPGDQTGHEHEPQDHVIDIPVAEVAEPPDLVEASEAQVLETVAGERGDGLLGDLDIVASHVTFTVVLRTRHLADGTMPVPAELHDSHLRIAPLPLAVRLGHDGDDLADDETFQERVSVHATPYQVRGLAWPMRFYPGILLTVTWTVGGRILDVTSERIPEPVEFGGVLLTHATDLTILAAFLGLDAPDAAAARSAAGEHAPQADNDAPLDGDSPGASGIGDPDEPAEDAGGDGGPVTDLEHGDRDLVDPRDRAYLALLLRAVVRAVEPDREGVRSFTAPMVVATSFAGLVVPKDAVGRAHRLLDAQAARGRLLRLPGEKRSGWARNGVPEGPPTYLWWPRGGCPPVQRLQNPRNPVVRSPSVVPVSLRKLPDGWAASPEKVASWPLVHASLGPTYLPKQLPDGHTWVEAHERGSDPGWRSGAVRRT